MTPQEYNAEHARVADLVNRANDEYAVGHDLKASELLFAAAKKLAVLSTAVVTSHYLEDRRQ